MAEHRDPRTVQQPQIRGDEQNPELRRPEPSVRHLEPPQRVRCQIALAGEQQKRHQHRGRNPSVHQSGHRQPAQQRRRSKDVHDVIHVEAVARPLLPAHARQGSVEAVAQPVQNDEHNPQSQRPPIPPRQRIADAGSHLRGEPHRRQPIRRHPPRRPLRHAHQQALLRTGGERPIHPRHCFRHVPRHDICNHHRHLSVQVCAPGYGLPPTDCS